MWKTIIYEYDMDKFFSRKGYKRRPSSNIIWYDDRFFIFYFSYLFIYFFVMKRKIALDCKKQLGLTTINIWEKRIEVLRVCCCLPFTRKNRLVDGCSKWDASNSEWKFPRGCARSISTTFSRKISSKDDPSQKARN